jgi:hypothetical protein
MFKKIAKYNAEVMRYTINKEDFEKFKTTISNFMIVSETEDRITVDVIEYISVIEKY